MLDVKNSMCSQLFQKPRNHQHTAQQNPAGVGSNISGLHVPQAGSRTPHELTDSVHRAVNHEHVDEFPEKLTRHAHDRPNDEDRKSTRLNSSHTVISYAVFCLKK